MVGFGIHVWMKTRLLLATMVLTAITLRADPLTSADREALLEKLEQLRDTVDSRVDARYRAAIAAYQSAASSDAATSELFVNCVEKVDFKDRQRKNSDFRNWKRQEADRLSSPGFTAARRLQLRWLILTLRAASANADRSQLVSNAQDIVNTIVRDASKFRGHEGILNEAVTSSVFARAYEINDVRLENWPLAPGNIGQVYDQVLLPPLRQQRQTEELRAAWTRRIQYEISLRDNPAPVSENGSRKIGMASAMRSPEYDLFMAESVPELQWRMEVDLFRHGEERAAAMRMFAHLEKNLTHKSVRDWGEQFVQLISPPQARADGPAS
jgi:hypothetical protein